MENIIIEFASLEALEAQAMKSNLPTNIKELITHGAVITCLSKGLVPDNVKIPKELHGDPQFTVNLNDLTSGKLITKINLSAAKCAQLFPQCATKDKSGKVTVSIDQLIFIKEQAGYDFRLEATTVKKGKK